MAVQEANCTSPLCSRKDTTVGVPPAGTTPVYMDCSFLRHWKVCPLSSVLSRRNTDRGAKWCHALQCILMYQYG